MFDTYGVPISDGIRFGSIFIKTDPSKDICYTYINPQNIDNELNKYYKALNELQEEFEQLKLSKTPNIISQQMIELYHTILHDPLFTSTIPTYISQKKVSSQNAIIDKLRSVELEFAQLPNEYFKNRFTDFQSISNQLLEKLDGLYSPNMISEPCILVTKELSVAELLHMNIHNLRGVILEQGGGVTSHTAILLNSMEIPAIFGVDNITSKLQNNDTLIIDAYKGKIIVNPSNELLTYYQTLEERYDQYHEKLSETLYHPSLTKDNVALNILANAANIDDIQISKKNEADGIGLLRTEIFSMIHNELLDQSISMKHYCKMIEEMPDKSFCIRTIDLGGDKFLSEDNGLTFETNPYLGYRSTRYFLQEPKILEDQLDMLIKIHETHPHIKIMFPFVTNIEDIIKLKEIFLNCWKKYYNGSCTIPIGMMAEVPSTLICINDFLPYVDFISIGTNDLTQYILAADRGNPYISNYYQMANPAVLKLIYYAVDQCDSAKIPVSICGEIAKEPLYIRLLLGMGLREFSMSPKAIPMIKYILTNSTVEECKQLWRKVLAMQNHNDITQFLQDDLNQFLRLHNAFLET
ncbi:MAG: phosphoenolpyruvate--protein phosphotransferase [Brevinema sp.]